MLSFTLAALAAIHPSAVIVQSPPAEKHDAESVLDIVTQLVDRTRELTEFTAMYHYVSKTDDRILKLTYRAPDRGKLEVQHAGTSAITWMIGDRIVVHDRANGKLLTGEIDCSDMDGLSAEFDEFLVKEFSMRRDLSKSLGVGPVFWLEADIVDSDAAPRPDLFELRRVAHRPHVLGWFLSPASAWRGARNEGDNLVVVGDAGRLVLSKQSGFIEKVTYAKDSRCELLELRASADESEFTVPDLGSSATDQSQELRRVWAGMALIYCRTQLYRAAARWLYDRPTELDAFDAKAAGAFELLYRKTPPILHTTLRTLHTESIDKYIEWYERSCRKLVSEPERKSWLVRRTERWRTGHDAELTRQVDEFVDSIVSPAEPENPLHLERLLGLDKKAARVVLQWEVADPLRVRFKDGIRAAEEKVAAELASPAGLAIARMARETKELESFTATYSCIDDARTLRLVFRAPDRAKMEVRAGSASTIWWVIGDRFVMQTDMDGEPHFADVSCKALHAADGGFDEVMARDFPVGSEPAGRLGAGPVFTLDLVPNATDGKPLRFELSWSPRREHFLGWLDQLTPWNARDEGETLVRSVGARGRVVLSKKSGFIENLRFDGSSRCKLIEIVPTADESEFAVPEPKTAALDASTGSARLLASQFTIARRRVLYGSAVSYITDKPGDTGALDAKISRAFEALYRPIVPLSVGQEVERRRTSIDEYIKWYGEQLKVVATDPPAKEELDRRTSEWRAQLQDGFPQAVEGFIDHLVSIEVLTDSAHLTRIRALEKDAVRAVFQSEALNPLHERFDAGIRAAAADK